MYSLCLNPFPKGWTLGRFPVLFEIPQLSHQKFRLAKVFMNLNISRLGKSHSCLHPKHRYHRIGQLLRHQTNRKEALRNLN